MTVTEKNDRRTYAKEQTIIEIMIDSFERSDLG